MPKAINLHYQKFGRLTAITALKERKHGGILWLCRCVCGNKVKVPANALRYLSIISCGCLKRENVLKKVTTHGKSYTREYQSWHHMIQRCLNPSNDSYHNYGGRGITVCDRWVESFENFYADMGIRPQNTSLDRINNNGNYEPGNCRWADAKTQVNNSRKRTSIHGIFGC